MWSAVQSALDSILENPKGSIIIFLVAFGVSWVFNRLIYQQQIANLSSRLELAKDQASSYKKKLDGASPDEAAAMIRQLEESVRLLKVRVDGIGPRRLSDDQKNAMVAALAIGAGAHVSIAKDGASPDAATLSADISNVFVRAGWSVSNPMVLGIGNPPPTGISISFDPAEMGKPVQQAVVNAFNSAMLAFDVRPYSSMQHRPEQQKPIAEITLTNATNR